MTSSVAYADKPAALVESGSPGEEPSMFSIIDNNLLVHLTLFLDELSLASLLQTCKLWSTMEVEHRLHLWKTRVCAHYGPIEPLQHRRPATTTATATSDPSHPLPQNDSVTNVEEEGRKWKRFAQQLYFGSGNYVGVAMDSDTINFEPYPMHLYMSLHQENTTLYNTSETVLTWSTLQNATTRVGGMRLHRRASPVTTTSITASAVTGRHTTSWDAIEFTEIQLLRGTGILVPNNYFGYLYRPAAVILGLYAGGGAFWLQLEEYMVASFSTSDDRVKMRRVLKLHFDRHQQDLADVSSPLGTDDMLMDSDNTCLCWPYCEHAPHSNHGAASASSSSLPSLSLPFAPKGLGLYGIDLKPGLRLSGLAAIDTEPFDLNHTRGRRAPRASSVMLELLICDKVDRSQADAVVKVHGIDPGIQRVDISFKGTLCGQVKNPGIDGLHSFTFDVFVVEVIPPCANSYRVMIFVNNMVLTVPQNQAWCSEEAKFFHESRMCAWSQDNRLLGIVQNPDHRAGSFCIETL